jgi:coenzyme F420 hydrogenase subunit beta
MSVDEIAQEAYRGGRVVRSRGNRLKSFDDLYHEVIGVGLCTLCGACAGCCPQGAIQMRIDDYESGDAWPRLEGECRPCGVCTEICPGRDVPLLDLNRSIFGRERDLDNEPLGIFRGCLRGQAVSRRIRNESGTGGMGTALLAYALEAGIIDVAIVGGRDPEHPWRAKPMLATSADEVFLGVRSDMTMIPNPSLLHEAVVQLNHRRVGIIGLPCQSHGLRKLQYRGRPGRLADAIALVIALFCSRARPFRAQEHLLKECGGFASFDEIASLDYRAGPFPGCFTVTTKEGQIHRIGEKASGYGGYYHFGRDRCSMCIDFSGELADISLGDTYQMVGSSDPRWSATLVRTETGQELIERALRDGWIRVEEHDPTLIPASGGGWETSHHGSVVHLINRRRWGWPTPEYQYPNRAVLVQRTPATMEP